MGEEWDRFRTGRSVAYASGGELSDRADGRYGPVHTKRPARRCLACGRQEWSGSPCECAEPEWDVDASGMRAFQAWCEDWAREALRVLKPGGHLLAFGAPRLYHRLACGIEDAGFEMRDSLMWLFGQGYPKSHNLAGEWEGWGTTLKPAYEPIVMARKAVSTTVAGNMDRHGVGALNIDASRIAHNGAAGTWGAKQLTSIGYGGTDVTEYRTEQHPLGRWPANVIADAEAAVIIDAESGDRGGGYGVRGAGGRTYGEARSFQGDGRTVGYGDAGGASRFFFTPETDDRLAACPTEPASTAERPSDPEGAPAGSAPSAAATSLPLEEPLSPTSCLAPSTSETPSASATPLEPPTPSTPSAGGELAPEPQQDELIPISSPASDAATCGPTGTTMTTASQPRSAGSADAATSVSTPSSPERGARASRFAYVPKANGAERNAGLAADRENHHKTVKPVALMRWLCRLVAPPGAVILDPFLGSGTTGCAAALDGFQFIGIERDAQSVEVARARIAWWERQRGLADAALEVAVGKAEQRRQQEAARAEAGQLGLGFG